MHWLLVELRGGFARYSNSTVHFIYYPVMCSQFDAVMRVADHDAFDMQNNGLGGGGGESWQYGGLPVYPI